MSTTMDSPSTPPSRRSLRHLHAHPDDVLAHLTTPPSRKKPSLSPSHLHPSVTLHDLLSHSPHHRPDDPLDPASAPRRKPRSRTAAAAASLMACASPGKARRARRRLEKEIVQEDDVLERPPRKRKQTRAKGAAKKRLSMESTLPPSSPIPRETEVRDAVEQRGVGDGLWELFSDLVMWKNTAKSSLWFGLGSLFILSSSFSGEYGFSVISAASHVGILFLALAFFRDSVPQRQQIKLRMDLKLTEEDIVRVAKVALPVVNEVLAKSCEVFSGEPSMTLKVAPILLFTAKYGQLITLWRLFTTGFFLSFTVPKLYSTYSEKIHSRVEAVGKYVSQRWNSCQHKKLVAASTATVLWNLFSAKTRICAAFISVVILRYHKERHIEEESTQHYNPEEEQQQAMVILD